jgi:hypothetical protein
MNQDMLPSARELAIRANVRECLAPSGKKAATEEGGAFHASVRWREAVVLMRDGVYRMSSLGMHRPYAQMAPQSARH